MDRQMEQEIAHFMLRAAKFEFFLVNLSLDFAQVSDARGMKSVSGINWSKVAQVTERAHPFAQFDFGSSGFRIYVATVPQFLAVRPDGRVAWDSDVVQVNSWDTVFSRGYAQFRNNVAHGNKFQLPAPFTLGRTREFLNASHSLIDFVAGDICGDKDWETPLKFHEG